MQKRPIFWCTWSLIIILAIIGILTNVARHRQTGMTAGVKKIAAELPAVDDVTIRPAAASDVPAPATTKTPTPVKATNSTPAKTSPQKSNGKEQWRSPLGDPKARVTKKTFGLYVSPGHSPVSPEKFTGYHTGWDFETTSTEQTADVAVTAFCDGHITAKEWAKGYGGVVVQSCTLNGQTVTIIYGHLNIDSVTENVGDELAIGDKIGLLGQGNSQQTDGERKHLHFAIHAGPSVNILGYVQNQAELGGWIDPATFLGEI